MENYIQQDILIDSESNLYYYFMYKTKKWNKKKNIITQNSKYVFPNLTIEEIEKELKAHLFIDEMLKIRDELAKRNAKPIKTKQKHKILKTYKSDIANIEVNYYFAYDFNNREYILRMYVDYEVVKKWKEVYIEAFEFMGGYWSRFTSEGNCAYHKGGIKSDVLDVKIIKGKPYAKASLMEKKDNTSIVYVNSHVRGIENKYIL